MSTSRLHRMTATVCLNQPGTASLEKRHLMVVFFFFFTSTAITRHAFKYKKAAVWAINFWINSGIILTQDCFIVICTIQIGANRLPMIGNITLSPVPASVFWTRLNIMGMVGGVFMLAHEMFDSHLANIRTKYNISNLSNYTANYLPSLAVVADIAVNFWDRLSGRKSDGTGVGQYGGGDLTSSLAGPEI